MRWKALKTGQVHIRTDVVGPVTASELQHQLAATRGSTKQITSYAASLRGLREERVGIE